MKDLLTKAMGKQINHATNLIRVKGPLQNTITLYKNNLLEDKRR